MKLKLEIEFDNEEQMARVTEAIAASNRVQAVPTIPVPDLFTDSQIVPMSGTATPPVFNDEDVVEEPSAVNDYDGPNPDELDYRHTDLEATGGVAATAGPSVDTKTSTVKRRRKAKAEPVAKAAPLVDANEVMTDEERKANAKAVAAQMEKNVAASTVEEALTQTPKNFYSLTDFLNNFAVILNSLVKDSTLTHRSLQDYCAQFGVPFIYALSKDKKKLEAFFNQLVSEGHITKKGDY